MAWHIGILNDSLQEGHGFETRWILWVFCGNVLGQDNSEPQPCTVESNEINEYVSCCCDKTEIMLKNAVQSINQIVQDMVNPFPNNKFLDSSKLKEFADNSF